MNKEQFRKELEDACKFGYNKPRGRTIDSKVEPLHLNAINEYINARLAALDDGDGKVEIYEKALFKISNSFNLSYCNELATKALEQFKIIN